MKTIAKAKYLCPAVSLFCEDGSLDLENQGKLYDHLIESGVDGILVGGSSSEFFALDMETRVKMAKFALEHIDHRTKLIIGTSHMVADAIIRFSNQMLDAGVDAVMILPPYYFHFGPEALLQYYDHLAKEIHGSIYLYSFPNNVGYDIDPDVVLKLALLHSNIVGIKDTIGGMDHTRELIKLIKPQRPDFEIYSGFDDNFAHNVLSGGDGCIGALANIAPEITSSWANAFRQNDLESVAHYQSVINQLMELYAISQPFLPVVKEAVRLRGSSAYAGSTFPMPNTTVRDDARILEVFKRVGL